MILIQSVIIIISFSLVSLIEFAEADAQEQDIGALMDKGVALQNSGKNEEAIGYYDKALAIDPNQFEALYNKGLALLNLGRYVEAIEYTNKALAKDPNDVDALSNKGLALNYLGKYNESIEHYDKALSIDPSHFNALNNKGLALTNLGKYNESIGYYDKALAIDPNDVNALANKGLAVYYLGKYNESIGYYDKVLAIVPNHVGALINKGLSLGGLGQYEEAIGYFDKALAIDPNNTIALSGKRLVSQAVAQANQTETWINWTDPKTGLVYEILATGEYCIDSNNDYICDVTFRDGKMILDERPVGQPTPTPPVDEKLPLDQSREELEKLISELGNQTQLIWNCTMPDPKTQCFTKVLDNGTIFVGNGKPSYVEPTPLQLGS